MLNKNDLQAMKGHAPIVMVTAYDACFARMAEAAKVDMILVGDSGANVVLGYSSTREIGMSEMLMFVAAVRRGAPNTHIVADMPWQSDKDPGIALENARRFLQVGANSVKVEGANSEVLKYLCRHEINVVGHLGLLPQTATTFKQQGQSPEDAVRILQESKIVAQAGVFALVLEHIPEQLASLISQGLTSIPTIGIGAGKLVDGQVLVLHDVLGMHPFKVPPFATQHANLYAEGVAGLERFASSVRKK